SLRLSRSRIVIVIAACEQKRTYQQQCQQSWINVHFHNGHVLSVTSPSSHTTAPLHANLPYGRMVLCLLLKGGGEGLPGGGAGARACPLDLRIVYLRKH